MKKICSIITICLAVLLSGCNTNTQTVENKGNTQSVEESPIFDVASEEESSIEEKETEVVLDAGGSEEVIASSKNAEGMDGVTEKDLENSGSVSGTDNPFSEFQCTNRIDYDLENNKILIDGFPIDISDNESGYYGGYMFYYMGNSIMEEITNTINSGDLSKTEWRSDYDSELLEKAEQSDLAKRFVEQGGKILDYYILNARGFLGSPQDTEMIVIIRCEVKGEEYNTILAIHMISEAGNEEVIYRTVEIFSIKTFPTEQIMEANKE
jgi:hypothetical protein